MPAAYFVKDGVKYSVGDSILVESNEPLPFIARILGITSSSGGTHKLTVSWYYRPEDAAIPGGRKSFHGERELYASDHVDEISSATILGPCTVHSIDAYQELEEIRQSDYYTRFTFKVVNKEFLPPTVAVHCVCRMPENPDREMCQCDQCSEWYHPECLGLTLEQAAAISPFYCPNCTPLADGGLAFGALGGSTQAGWGGGRAAW